MHVDIDLKPGEQGARFVVHRRPVEQPEAPAFAAQTNVLGDRAIGDEIDLLIDRADPLRLRILRRRGFERAAAEHDLSGVTSDVASQDLDHRGFAGAVLADQRVDLADRDLERRRTQGGNPAKRLVDPAHRKQRGRGGLRRCHLPRNPPHEARRIHGSALSETIQHGSKSQEARVRLAPIRASVSSAQSPAPACGSKWPEAPDEGLNSRPSPASGKGGEIRRRGPLASDSTKHQYEPAMLAAALLAS